MALVEMCVQSGRVEGWSLPWLSIMESSRRVILQGIAERVGERVLPTAFSVTM